MALLNLIKSARGRVLLLPALTIAHAGLIVAKRNFGWKTNVWAFLRVQRPPAPDTRPFPALKTARAYQARTRDEHYSIAIPAPVLLPQRCYVHFP